MLDSVIVGRVIQQRREEKRLSQEIASGLAGMGRTHWSAIERGERKPTLETFWRVCHALDILPSEMMKRIEAYGMDKL